MKQGRPGFRVRCVETGQIFASSKEAARQLGIICPCCNNKILTPGCGTNIGKAAKKGIKSYGYNWEFV